MEKIIFFGLVIPILAFVLYLGGNAIMKGMSAKNANKENENSENNETENILDDVLTAEDAGDAQFELFLDTSGAKKVSFSGIVTGTSLSATTGDLETVSVSFITSGAITNAA